ncbi:MAG TPA: glucose-6-phosphate dehydrogenase assembly protein OpcA [Actinomycetes bacterium]
MTSILWDTNGTEIVKTLATERRAAGAIASGLALTLVVVADEKNVEEARTAATVAAAAHPCRVLVVVRRKVEADDRLDAEVQVGGHLGANESVVMRMYGRLTLHAESVVLPLLASDAPVVTWWHGDTPEKLAYDALAVLASRRVTDAFTAEDPLAELKRRAKDYAPGDTDLAWTRTTPWRALLAAGFDDLVAVPTAAEVQSQPGNASAVLLAGWLEARLGVKVKRSTSAGPGITSAEVRFGRNERLRIDRPDGYLATLSRTGMTDRQLPLKRRELGDLIAEELRRLDADQPYADALAAATGERDLDARPAKREHIWRDPMQRASRRTAKKATTKKTASKKTATVTTAKKRATTKTAAKSTAKTSAGRSTSRRGSS